MIIGCRLHSNGSRRWRQATVFELLNHSFIQLVWKHLLV